MARNESRKLKELEILRRMNASRITEVFAIAKQAEADNTCHLMFKIRYRDLSAAFDNFCEAHAGYVQLLAMQPTHDLQPEDDLRKDMDSKYYEMIAIYETLVPQPTISSASPAPASSTPTNGEKHNVKLPRILLPHFDGKIENWQSYIDLYNSLVHTNGTLSDSERFQYLISSLSQAPLAMVKSLPITSANYAIAYQNLVNRYQNRRLLATQYWNAIHDFPAITSERSLRPLVDNFSENLSALKVLNFPIEQWDFILFNVMLSKLDDETRKRFELNSEPETMPTYDQLKSFVEHQCKALEAMNPGSDTKPHSLMPNLRTSKGSKRPNNKGHVFMMQTDSVSTCPSCQREHDIHRCASFLSKQPTERFAFAKENKLCINCLRSSHKSSKCPSKGKCKQCGQAHHTLLHFGQTANNPRVPHNSEAGPSHQNRESPISLSTTNPNATVLLGTAVAHVVDARGNRQQIRVVLDCGSHINSITRSCVDRLGLHTQGTNLQIFGLNNCSIGTSKELAFFTMRSNERPHNKFEIDAFVFNEICGPTPASPLIRNYRHLNNLKLADPSFHTPQSIDVLLGAKICPYIIKSGRRYGAPNEPVAIETVFGWVLMGETPDCGHVKTHHASCHLTLTSLDDTLKKFWSLEEVPTTTTTLSPDDKKCEEMYVSSVTRTTTGRFVVKLPFKGEDPQFGDSYSTAVRRLLSQERRLAKNPELQKDYTTCLEDYLQLGHMEPVETPSDKLRTYYIPHHCVLKPDSQTTKLRVVFDASAKTTNGLSLNDALLVGPRIQKDLIQILFSFRFHNIVFTADIKNMYRNVLIAPEHRDYQRILWRREATEPIQEFRLKTVTFGVAAAPFLAIRTLKQLANEENGFPAASQVLKTDTYVDDIVTGADSLEQALNIKNELIQLLSCGGFELRKWASNDPAFCATIPEEILQSPSLSFDTDSVVKILGLRWHPSGDYFAYDVAPVKSSPTKRSLLSELAKIFDPMGFLAPLTFFAKHLIQHLWCLGLDWDETPPEDVIHQWSLYQNQLSTIKSIKIPRQFSSNDLISCQLHGFADASSKGYAAVVYFRGITANGQITTHLVIGKSKVAPLKQVSIPRLELCAAVLLSNLISFVLKNSSRCSFDNIWAWSDSMVTLAWIKESPHKWKTFVGNRTAHIQERVAANHWRHVPSADNPADVASRGLLPSDLASCSLWWAGPSWLRTPETTWPGFDPNSDKSEQLIYAEERKTVLFTANQSSNLIAALLNKFSSLEKIQRIVAYILRWTNNTQDRHSRRDGALSSPELHQALMLLVKEVQKQAFADDIENLKSNKPCSKPLRKLNPFVDDQGILRVGGRIHKAKMTYDQRHPILLPRTDRLTELIIDHAHTKHLHTGAQTLQFIIQQQFWILSSRRAIRQRIGQCLRCYRLNPRPIEPVMGDLPASRISQIKPFSIVGVDFGGPYLITATRTRGAKTRKAYICLFVCFATKAVHIELASELSTNVFLAALRRFIARRGRCSKIVSDCGTNFVGAHKYLALQMKSAADTEKIEWQFNPPSAPHFGGLWEAGIKSVKTHLQRVIGDQILSYEEFYTFLVQAEAILNSRPLSALSSDPRDLSALTPGHFLTLEPLTALPEPDLTDVKQNRLTRWQLIQQCQQTFWKRWHQEYLHTLTQRTKWTTPRPELTIGTLVLIKNELTPPLRWRLGRVVETHKGSDGVCRVATVRTATGNLKRPVVKLCPLPTSN